MWTRTDSTESFQFIQNFLHNLNIAFLAFNLPENQSLRTVIRSIPLDIVDDEIHLDLENREFTVKLVKRFGAPNKQIPICLVIFSRNSTATEIFNLDNMFYIKIRVEDFKRSGLSQCHSCQSFGHGSLNYFKSF